MMKRCISAILLFLVWTQLLHANTDSIPTKGLKYRLKKFVECITAIDTNYIEPQKFHFTTMLQNTNNYESYTLRDKFGHSVQLSPEPSVKVGPFFGWHWLVLGYAIDITHLGGKKKRKDLDISLYSNQVGIDLFYRTTGNDYKLRNVSMGSDVDTKALKNIDYPGFNASIKGFNMYYIFNHRKFSYPAAFSQTTRQKRSRGSALIGVGYTKHTLEADWNNLTDIVSQYIDPQVAKERLDSNLWIRHIRYTDVSVSGGYAYNWVFAPRWLFSISASIALAYKQSIGDSERKSFSFRDFRISNFNLDAVSRVGLVWNNSRWYAGMSAIFHSYHYSKSQFSTNSMFGSLNVYVGFNFGRIRH